MADFAIDRVISLLREAVQPLPKAAMFELAERGYQSPFQQLVACILSIRTYDEVSLPAAERLLSVAETPEEMAKLTPEQIDRLIQDCTYHESKCHQIWQIAAQIIKEYDGKLPCDEGVMRSFKGVGPKCAHLALGIACGQPWISVDVHVHRVTNRWGYVQARTPEKTLIALEAILPRQYWVEINQLLVPFGKHVCMGTLPKCSTCPIATDCQRVGVVKHR
ncbi:MAG: endonuclease III [Elainella sp. Prado103]|jgi:endonuclease-3|nr:endonuclease III [Elainella sp. Prado103]